jgi:hypothetical protein
MAYSRRSYKGAAVSNTVGGSGLAANATTITLGSAMSGWSTSGIPFFVVVDPGTAKEEKVCVIYASSTTLTVVDPAVTSSWTASVNGRGTDDTTDRAHDTGAVIYPVFTATEANQANELVSKYTVNGDLVVHGSSGFKTIATGGSGNNNKVLIADSTVTDGGVKWATVGTDSITDSAITSGKIADGAIVNADINASAAIALSKLATGSLPTAITVASANLVDGTIVEADLADGAVTSVKIADGTIVNADINASAAIALTKLADGALPTGVTVASANLVDLTIDTADIKDDAITAAKIAANAVGSSEIATGAVGADEIATGAVGTDEIADNAVTNAKLPTNSFALTYQDFTASTNITANPYGEDVKVTLTGGKVYTDVVSVTAWGTNSHVRVFSWQVGPWTGVQTSAEVVVSLLLGNNAASNNVNVRVWLK